MAQTKMNLHEQGKANSLTSAEVDTSVLVSSGANPFTGNANLGGNRATNAANASAGTDLVTLSQVQSLLMGISPLISVQAMTTGAESFTISSGSVTQISGTTVDGVSGLAVGDRILIKNAPATSGTGTADVSNAGSDQPANGVYTITNATTNLTVTRDSTSVTPLSGSVNPAGKTVFAEAGSANKAAGYIVGDPTTPDTAFTYGTTNMQWGKFNAGGSVTNVSIVSANGLAGTVANPSTTPAVTLTTSVTGLVKGNGTAFSAATAGTDYLNPANIVQNETPSGSINGSNTAFTLANTPNANITSNVELFLNGVLLEPGSGNDFTISGTSVTMLFAPATGDKLRAYYYK